MCSVLLLLCVYICGYVIVFENVVVCMWLFCLCIDGSVLMICQSGGKRSLSIFLLICSKLNAKPDFYLQLYELPNFMIYSSIQSLDKLILIY